MSEQSNDSIRAIALRQQLGEWFDQPLGRSLQAVEANRLRSVWPHFRGNMAVQLGRIGSMDLMDACPAARRYLLDLPGFNPPSLVTAVHGEVEALPFDSRSIDLALLPHTLEFASDPHQVLREVQRVLTPEGHIVILGFNPMSLWGLWRMLRRSDRAPWNGHFIPAHQGLAQAAGLRSGAGQHAVLPAAAAQREADGPVVFSRQDR